VKPPPGHKKSLIIVRELRLTAAWCVSDVRGAVSFLAFVLS